MVLKSTLSQLIELLLPRAPIARCAYGGKGAPSPPVSANALTPKVHESMGPKDKILCLNVVFVDFDFVVFDVFVISQSCPP